MDAPTATQLSTPAPDESRPPRFTGRLIIGVAVIVLGVLFLLDAFDVPGIGDVWHYVGRLWPIVFVMIGVTKLANSASNSERVGSVIWLILGGLLLASNFDLITFNVWRAFWPLLLIVFGFSLMTRGRVKFSGRWHGAPGATAWTDSGARTSALAILSGATRRMSSPDFQGGDATSIMGGCEIDLRQCNIITSPAEFDAFALMGGIELYVPGDWTIRNEGIAILGAIEDSRKETAGNPAKVLILRGAAIMGGIEIKN